MVRSLRTIRTDQFEKFFHTLGKTFIAGGDFNSKSTLWGSRLKTTKGRELEKVLQAQNYTPLSAGTPTCWPTDANKIPDLLDFFVTSGISPSYTDIKPSYDLSSDHTPTIMTISTSLATHITTTRLHTSITDWNQYKTVVRDKLTTKIKLKTREDIEFATSELIDILQQAVKTATPVKTVLGR